MTRIVLSREAQGDSDAILSSLARDAGAQVAARYARRFDRLYGRLADHPDSGAARPRLGPEVRIGIGIGIGIPFSSSTSTIDRSDS